LRDEVQAEIKRVTGIANLRIRPASPSGPHTRASLRSERGGVDRDALAGPHLWAVPRFPTPFNTKFAEGEDDHVRLEGLGCVLGG